MRAQAELPQEQVPEQEQVQVPELPPERVPEQEQVQVPEPEPEPELPPQEPLRASAV